MRKVWWRTAYEESNIMGPYRYKGDWPVGRTRACVSFLGSL